VTTTINPEPTRPKVGVLRGSGVVVLIGLVTLTGALLTWRSVTLGGEADDADRRVLLDTISRERAELRAESQVRFESVQFARYRAELVAAAAFATAGLSSSDLAVARSFAETARSLLEQASARMSVGAVRAEYVITGDTPDDLKYDVARLRRDLERQGLPYLEAESADPAITRRVGDRLHDRSLLVGLAVVGLAAMVTVLTVGEVAGGRRRRVLAIAGGVGAVAITLTALVGPGY
jgi:hypothetical protein